MLNEFDNFLVNLTQNLPETTQLDARYVPVIDARIRNTASEFNWANGASRTMVTRLGGGREALRVLLQWCVEGRSPHAQNILLEKITDSVRNRVGAEQRPITYAAEAGLPFSPAQFRELFVHLAIVDPGQLAGLTRSLVCMSDVFAPEFLPIASDPKQPLRVRALALWVAASSAKQQLVPIVLDVLRDERWPASAADSELVGAITGTGYLIEHAASAQILEQALAPQGNVAAEAVTAFALGYARSNALSPREADAILAMWGDKQLVHEDLVRAALNQVAARPRAAQGDWLLRGLRDNDHVLHTLRLIGESRDPSYLPALRGLLGSDSAPERFKTDPLNSRDSVINCLTRYFDDAAAEILLEFAGSTADFRLRDSAFAALETIRKYRAEKGRWEESRTSKEATTAAVKELVGLLDDPTPAVRAQAARGLGTLRALEQMPRLVRLLKDPDETVRKAASDALEVLNAPAK